MSEEVIFEEPEASGMIANTDEESADAPRKKVRKVKELSAERKAEISARLKAGREAAKAKREAAKAEKTDTKPAVKQSPKPKEDSDVVLAELRAMRKELADHRAAKAKAKAEAKPKAEAKATAKVEPSLPPEQPPAPTKPPPPTKPQERTFHERICARTGRVTKIYHH